MATAVNPNPAAPVAATTTPEANAAANTAAPTGVAATQDTMQTAQTAETAAPESKGICAQIGAFFKGIADGIASFFSSVFSKIKSLFVKAESAPNTETPAQVNAPTDTETPAPAATPLEAFRSAVNQGLGRDEIVVAFALLEAPVQEAVKGQMWILAGADIQDRGNIQPNERHNAPDWAGRVIRNEVQLDGEVAPRADIQRYVDITADGSLFRRALDVVIQQHAVAAEAAAAAPATV